MTLRVFIVDDDPLVCRSLTTLLESPAGGLSVVGQAHTVHTARAELLELPAADVLLVDVHLPDGCGLELLDTGIPTVIMTALDEADTVREAIARGAAGYVSKASDASVFTAALRQAVQEGSGSTGVYASKNVHSILAPPSQRRALPNPLPNLSAQEAATLDLVLEGLNNREIAAELSYSVGAVKKFVSSLLAKYGATNRRELIVAALTSEA